MTDTAKSRAPRLRLASRDAWRNLPGGKTCADCVEFVQCAREAGSVPWDEVCRWIPVQFHEAKKPDAPRLVDIGTGDAWA